MNEVTLTEEEQKFVVIIVNEIMRRDGHTIEDVHEDMRSAYYKCGGK